MFNFEFDPNDKHPRYYQLYLFLKESIKAGEYKAGECLPSESEMIEQTGASRITVRQAVAELENDGLIKKHRGKGSIVLADKTISDLDSLKSFTETAEANGDRISYIVLNSEVLDAKAKTADELEVQVGEKIFELKRLLLLNGRIAGYTIAYLPYKKELEDMFYDFDERTSLFKKLNEKGVVMNYAKDIIEVVLPSQTVKRELRMESNDPVVKSRHFVYDLNDNVVVYTKAYFLYNKFRYTITTRKGNK